MTANTFYETTVKSYTQSYRHNKNKRMTCASYTLPSTNLHNTFHFLYYTVKTLRKLYNNFE